MKDYVIISHEDTCKKMLTGMCISAKTIGAQKAYIYLRYEYRNLKEIMLKYVEEVKKLHADFANIEFEIRLGAGPYVAGEETA